MSIMDTENQGGARNRAEVGTAAGEGTRTLICGDLPDVEISLLPKLKSIC